VFKHTFKEYGKVDIVVANAGVTDVQLGEDLFGDTFDDEGELAPPKSKTIDVNFTGGLNTIKLALHYFSKNPTPGGKLVITGTQACFVDEYLPGYMASKYALRAIMRSIYPNAPKFGVTINMVAPALTETGMMPPGARQQMEQMGFIVNNSDAVGRAVVFLAVGEKDESGVEKWNGKTVYVAGDTFKEVEDAYNVSRSEWLGTKWVEMAERIKGLGFIKSKSGW
jgi:NAD(P)-dependent dehydrogenase (short-subunit alcohol dehydrogenase family)